MQAFCLKLFPLEIAVICVSSEVLIVLSGILLTGWRLLNLQSQEDKAL